MDDKVRHETALDSSVALECAVLDAKLHPHIKCIKMIGKRFKK